MSDRGAHIRDLFFALWRPAGESSADRGEREAELRRLLAELGEQAATTTLQGLGLSYFPTVRRKQLRFVEAEELDPQLRSLFARPVAALPGLAAAFVDPEEFSYRSFENIIGLDRLFAGQGAASSRFVKVRKLADGVMQMRLDAPKSLSTCLAQLDLLGLYMPPFDRSRGGLRFIFHSAELAATLTAALHKALPAPMRRGFVHVNPVFRCNRFEPGDAPFGSHVDSPYYDRSQNHVSKYTLLLYLTPGRGDAPLSFTGGPKIGELEAMTALVFEQGRAHEGRPYVDGRKVFLRSELVFVDEAIEHAPGIAELFAKACYLGGESVFLPELAAFAHEAYDRAAAAHWRGPPDAPAAEPYVHKQFRGAHFVSNGHDYWFLRGPMSLTECAALALLDLLNAKIGDEPFRKLCERRVEVRGGDDRAWIAALLRDQAPAPEPVFGVLDKSALFPPPEQPLRGMDFPTSPDFDAAPFPDDWDGPRNASVIEVYARAQRWAKRRIVPAPITLLGKQLFLDPARFVVAGDKIHVLSRERLGPMHFAGAVFFHAEDFVGVDVRLTALHPLVPPISFAVAGELLHLRCDLFRNSWMVSLTREETPVPRVLAGTAVEPDTAAWLQAARLDRAWVRGEK